MYPDERLRLLSKQSCSNFYKLIKDLEQHQCSIALGAGASATVGLPTWTHLLKRICHCYFSEWISKISTGKATVYFPPSNVSIGRTESFEQYVTSNQRPSEIDKFDTLTNVKIISNGSELSKEKIQALIGSLKKGEQLQSQLQDEFMEKIMSGDLTIISQMIKNQVRPRDWNYLIRKSLYSSYEHKPYVLHISPLYDELILLLKKCAITNIINYNYDDTFHHALKKNGSTYENCYEGKQVKNNCRIYYPHGFIPMNGGVTTKIVLCEDEYQSQIYQQNLWSNNVQITTLSSSTCVFIGLSLNDANIRRLLNMCSNAKQYMHYAFLPTSGNDQVSIMCDHLFDSDLYRFGIRVIRYSPENDHVELVNLIHCLYDISKTYELCANQNCHANL